jgi:hypothetical protein
MGLKMAGQKNYIGGISMQQLDPEVIYFTHSKIRKRFSGCNKLLAETLQEVLEGRTPLSAIPRIRVIHDGNRYYSMNNRRLWLFKELKRAGYLTLVDVEVRAPVSGSEKRLGTGMLSLSAKPVLA